MKDTHKLKLGRKFDVFEFPEYTETVQTYYDKDANKFRAEYKGELLSEESPKLLRAALLTLIKGQVSVVWLPVIEVEFSPMLDVFVHGERRERVFQTADREGDSERRMIELSVRRYYVAKRPNGTWVRVPWGSGESTRLTTMESFHVNGDKLPYFHDMGRNRKAYLPYAEERWRKLLWLADDINRFNGALGKLIRLGFDTVSDEIPPFDVVVQTMRRTVP